MVKIRGRIKERKIRAFFSDESESEEDIPEPIKKEATIDEYNLIKQERRQAKLAVVAFVKKFREDNQG